jgi:hypothetical protein
MRDLTKLPQWEPCDQRGRDELKRWTIERLNDERAEMLAAAQRSREMISHQEMFAMVTAERGDLTLLRRLHPNLAPFLQPPRRARGKYKRHARPCALEQAVLDVRRVRSIWRTAFGRWRRSDHLAEEIAAERWQINESELDNALRKLHA